MNDYSDWIGRTDSGSETLTPALAERFAVTLDAETGAVPGSPAPLGIHWCLAQPALPRERLGEDGHPALGEILPPVPLRRRMWAGGKLVFHDALRIGDEVARKSTIASIEMKTGRSGQLCFVAVQHEWTTPRGLAIAERQDIVYRDPSPVGTPAPTFRKTALGGGRERSVPTDATLLFRYSALTFNGHRIHYDHPYATGVEGYAGLVVHGPLQATWLLRFAAEGRGFPKEFSFRSEQPVMCGETIRLIAREDGATTSLEAVRADGTVATGARASF